MRAGELRVHHRTGDYDALTTSYKKRVASAGNALLRQPSLKSNAGLAKSPTQALRTQSSHIFMSIYAAFKLECLSLKAGLNLRALRARCLANATRSAFENYGCSSRLVVTLKTCGTIEILRLVQCAFSLCFLLSLYMQRQNMSKTNPSMAASKADVMT